MWNRAALLSCALVVVTAGCSGKDTGAARSSPTAPTGLQAITVGAPDTADARPSAAFPSRSDAFDFRRQLETKYAARGRAASPTAVDQEGDVVWVSEYIRYRVDGCDHPTAIDRVFGQVAGGPAGPSCAESPTGLIVFPPRNETLDFRKQLEARYAAMGRATTSTVDIEGSAIWIQEYLRYRTNACDHATAVQSVFTQVDGGAAPRVCYVEPICAFRFAEPFVNAPGSGGTYTVGIYDDSTGSKCSWTATADSWITFPSGNTGNAAGSLTYVIADNPGNPREGAIRLDFPGGSARLPIAQSEPQYFVSMYILDGARSVNPANDCFVQTTSTKCTLTPITNLPNAIAIYDWQVQYTYGGQVTRTQVGAGSTFTITESCGGPGSTATGTDVDVAVRLTVTDQVGRTATVNSGAGRVPALRFKMFTCS